MNKFSNIVKSRFIKGEDLPVWYEERLQICSDCEFNSKNIEETEKSKLRKGWEYIAGAHCTDPSCGCTITQKAKIETEECPKNYWQKVVNKSVGVKGKLDVYISNNKVLFTFDKNTNNYVIDYGQIPFQYESSVDIYIKNKNITNIETKTSCGCTTANPVYFKDKIKIQIKYDTNRIGVFSKKVSLSYKINNSFDNIIFEIKGEVKKRKDGL